MSLHSALFQSASLPLLFEQHADSGRVTYTPKGGSTVSLSAIVGNEKAMDDSSAAGERRVLRRPVTITTDPAGTYGGVATPATNATVVVDNVNYAVESLQPLAAGYMTLVLVRPELQLYSRPDYHQRAHYGRARQ